MRHRNYFCLIVVWSSHCPLPLRNGLNAQDLENRIPVSNKDGLRNTRLASRACFVVDIVRCSTGRLVTVSGTRIRTYRIGAASNPTVQILVVTFLTQYIGSTSVILPPTRHAPMSCTGLRAALISIPMEQMAPVHREKHKDVG